MPYSVVDDAPGCSGYAVVKDGTGEVMGCHATQAEADDQLTALNIAEFGDRFMKRAEGDPYAVIADVDGTIVTFEGDPIQRVIDYLNAEEGELVVITARLESERDDTLAELEAVGLRPFRLIMKPSADVDSVDFKRATAEELLRTRDVSEAIDDDEQVRAAYAELGIEAKAPGDIEADDDEDELRQVDTTPPAYIRNAARRGVEYYEQGLAGDGVTAGTIREARAMARGDITEDKVVRASAWGARHAVDLESADNSDANADGFPGAGAVAHYLWGIDPLNPAPARAWFDRKAEQVKSERGAAVDTVTRDHPTTNLVRAATVDRAAEVDMEGRILSGYFSVFNEWYEVNSAYEGRFMERIAPGAFAETLARQGDRIKVLYDHGADPSLGNKPLGVIRSMSEDKRGAYYEVELIDTDYNRDFIIPAARAGLLGSSFRFMVTGETWSDPKRATSMNPLRLPERTITATEVYEFGPVTFPANPGVGAVAIRSTTDEWFDRLLHDPQFVARFTARVGLSNVERALEQAPVVVADATCDTVRSVDGPPDGRSDTLAQQPTDGRSKARTKNQRLAAVAKALPPKE